MMRKLKAVAIALSLAVFVTLVIVTILALAHSVVFVFEHPLMTKTQIWLSDGFYAKEKLILVGVAYLDYLLINKLGDVTWGSGKK